MSLSAYTTPSPALRGGFHARRSFAIISHPDAGKTTLTEKFLLYGGALQLAGSVTAKKNQRATTSDWMEMEKQRVSVSSTVLQFEYKNCVVNILDTPGHKDFSEDTYVLTTNGRRRDGGGRGQGHRVADAEALRGLPPPGCADFSLS